MLTNPSTNGKNTQSEEESGEFEGQTGQLTAELDEEGAAFTCQISGGTAESGGGKEATEIIEPTTNTLNKWSQIDEDDQTSEKLQFSDVGFDDWDDNASSASDSSDSDSDNSNTDNENQANLSNSSQSGSVQVT